MQQSAQFEQRKKQLKIALCGQRGTALKRAFVAFALRLAPT